MNDVWGKIGKLIQDLILSDESLELHLQQAEYLKDIFNSEHILETILFEFLLLAK